MYSAPPFCTGIYRLWPWRRPDSLGHNPALQPAVGRHEDKANASTVCCGEGCGIRASHRQISPAKQSPVVLQGMVSFTESTFLGEFTRQFCICLANTIRLSGSPGWRRQKHDGEYSDAPRHKNPWQISARQSTLQAAAKATSRCKQGPHLIQTFTGCGIKAKHGTGPGTLQIALGPLNICGRGISM